MNPKEKKPPPLVLTNTVVNLIHIHKLITDVNQVHVMIVWVFYIQTQNVSIRYLLCFGVIHLAYLLK